MHNFHREINEHLNLISPASFAPSQAKFNFSVTLPWTEISKQNKKQPNKKQPKDIHQEKKIHLIQNFKALIIGTKKILVVKFYHAGKHHQVIGLATSGIIKGV